MTYKIYKVIFVSFLFFNFSNSSFAQGNSPCTATSIDACAGTTVAFDLPSDGGNDGFNSGTCGLDGNTGTWVSFTPTTLATLTITLGDWGGCGVFCTTDPTGALYFSDDCNNLIELDDCIDMSGGFGNGNNTPLNFTVYGGTTYYFRLSEEDDQNMDADITFELSECNCTDAFNFTTTSTACPATSFDFIQDAACSIAENAGNGYIDFDVYLYSNGGSNEAPGGYDPLANAGGASDYPLDDPNLSFINGSGPGNGVASCDDITATSLTNNTCDPIVTSYFVMVWDRRLVDEGASSDGAPILGEYNSTHVCEDFFRFDVTVLPAPKTVEVTPPDCNGNGGMAVLKAADGSTCDMVTGTGGTSPECPAIAQNGLLVYSFGPFNVGEICEQAVQGESIEAPCDCIEPLPVTLTKFEGYADKDVNILNWETSSELNTNYFEIERSDNGRDNWTAIGKEQAQGTANIEQSYSMNDVAPISKAYYRLRSVDFDASFQLSDIIFIERDGKDISVTRVYPNPTNTSVTIEFKMGKAGAMQFSLLDATGKLIRDESIELAAGDHQQQIDLESLPKGMYMIAINNGTAQTMHKIIKK